MLLPKFLIIGTQRAGTTSLYQYLIQHQEILPSKIKETHFFSNNFHKGLSWYESQFSFPQDSPVNHQNSITGEATPYYIFHPLSPKRIAKIIPDVKIIILLRNPVDRAYSHYNHIVKLGHENLSFEDAIKIESERLEGEEKKILEGNYSFNHQHFSYISRSRYVDQLRVWLKLFPKNHIMIIKSEEFFDKPENILSKVFSFLKLSNMNFKKFEKFNEGEYKPIDSTTKEKLINYFKPYNEQLYNLLGKNFHWDEN